MIQQRLWDYKVEDKLHLREGQQKQLTTTGLERANLNHWILFRKCCVIICFWHYQTMDKVQSSPHHKLEAITFELKYTALIIQPCNNQWRSFGQWRMSYSGMLLRATLVLIDISEERIASIIRMKRIGKLGTLAVTSNRSTFTVVKTSNLTSFEQVQGFCIPASLFFAT
jgi:hypothetical protein